ncbi:MAG: DUF2442 domain-containing protein [Campylobacterota bacterium]|nr:DUF2442 domain-containing protein [Campylobacterota bacterium]
MKLIKFNIIKNYIFDLYFEDDTMKRVDLSNLIKSKVSKEELSSAHIDSDWGCLEFKNGYVDIDPKTLYIYNG